jgi:Rieske Fe-S protein
MRRLHDLDRKGFVKIMLAFLGSVMSAVVGLPAISYLFSPALKIEKSESWISLGAPDHFPIGVPTLFSFTRTKVNGWERTVNGYGVYVVRYSESDVNVFSNKCTHLSCRVTWSGEAYQCPCHDARFDIQGNVLHGPPPAPLHPFETKIENDTLMIYFTEG